MAAVNLVGGVRTFSYGITIYIISNCIFMWLTYIKRLGYVHLGHQCIVFICWAYSYELYFVLPFYCSWVHISTIMHYKTLDVLYFF